MVILDPMANPRSLSSPSVSLKNEVPSNSLSIKILITSSFRGDFALRYFPSSSVFMDMKDFTVGGRSGCGEEEVEGEEVKTGEVVEVRENWEEGEDSKIERGGVLWGIRERRA